MFCAQQGNFTIYSMDVSLVLLGISKNTLISYMMCYTHVAMYMNLCIKIIICYEVT